MDVNEASHLSQMWRAKLMDMYYRAQVEILHKSVYCSSKDMTVGSYTQLENISFGEGSSLDHEVTKTSDIEK